MSFKPGDTVYVTPHQQTAVVESVDNDNVGVTLDNGFLSIDKSELVGLSMHAQNRWKEYIDAGISIADEAFEAWHRGVELSEPHGLNGDEVRYDEKLNIVIVRKDVSITTVINTKNCKPELEEAISRV